MKNKTPMAKLSIEFSEIKFLLKDFFIFTVLNQKNQRTDWYKSGKSFVEPHISKKVSSKCVYLFHSGNNRPSFAVLFSDNNPSELVFSYQKDNNSDIAYSEKYSLEDSKVILRQFVRNLSSLNISNGTSFKDCMVIFESIILETFKINKK